MKTVSEFLLAYAGIAVMLEIAVFAVIMITFQIKQIKVTKETNKAVRYMTDRIKAYLTTILEDDEEEGPMSRQEANMRKSLEKTRRKQDEEVFDAVLQEIFP